MEDTNYTGFGKGKATTQVDYNIKLDKEKIQSKRTYHIIKRAIDIMGSSIGLLISTPIVVCVAIAMKFDEPKGPIFFSQIRIGKDGREFKMYKIRSMCVDAEDKLSELLKHNEIEGAMFKMKEDPRITRIGKVIRKTSIDELPQLYNVLKGNMSLVGPRPPLVREVEEYSDYHMQRLYIKPGCTGLWQVSSRNDCTFEEMVELDLKYIEDLSLANDIMIILKTFLVIIKPNGAY